MKSVKSLEEFVNRYVLIGEEMWEGVINCATGDMAEGHDWRDVFDELIARRIR